MTAYPNTIYPDERTLPFFLWRGRSSLEFCLLLTEKNAYRSAARDVTFTSIPGRDGDLLTDNGRFKKVSVTYKAAFVHPTNTGEYQRTTAEIAREIKSWLLADVGYFRLMDSYDPGVYRLAAYVDEAEIEEELRGVGEIALTFQCKPFKYLLTGDEAILFTEPGMLYNAQAFASCPLIRIIGNGDGVLMIGNGAYTFKGMTDELTIDSEMMTAYRGNVSCMRQMATPSFPRLEVGENTISWNGGIERVEITPRWRCL